MSLTNLLFFTFYLLSSFITVNILLTLKADALLTKVPQFFNLETLNNNR